MTPIAYTGFRPTSHFIGVIWLGRSLIGIEVAPDAFGLVIWNLWIGVVNEE